jgi:hypothetical protein
MPATLCPSDEDYLAFLSARRVRPSDIAARWTANHAFAALAALTLLAVAWTVARTVKQGADNSPQGMIIFLCAVGVLMFGAGSMWPWISPARRLLQRAFREQEHFLASSSKSGLLAEVWLLAEGPNRFLILPPQPRTPAPGRAARVYPFGSALGRDDLALGYFPPQFAMTVNGDPTGAPPKWREPTTMHELHNPHLYPCTLHIEVHSAAGAMKYSEQDSWSSGLTKTYERFARGRKSGLWLIADPRGVIQLIFD